MNRKWQLRIDLLRYRWNRTLSKDALSQRVAGMLPQRVVFFCYIRVMSHANNHMQRIVNGRPRDDGATQVIVVRDIDSLSFNEVCDLWEARYNRKSQHTRSKQHATV